MNRSHVYFFEVKLMPARKEELGLFLLRLSLIQYIYRSGLMNLTKYFAESCTAFIYFSSTSCHWGDRQESETIWWLTSMAVTVAVGRVWRRNSTWLLWHWVGGFCCKHEGSIGVTRQGNGQYFCCSQQARPYCVGLASLIKPCRR